MLLVPDMVMTRTQKSGKRKFEVQRGQVELPADEDDDPGYTSGYWQHDVNAERSTLNVNASWMLPGVRPPVAQARCLRSAGLGRILRQPAQATAAPPLISRGSAMLPSGTAPQPNAAADSASAQGFSTFQVTAREGNARAGRLETPHGAVLTPAALMYTRFGSAMYLATDMLDKLRHHGVALQLNAMHLCGIPVPVTCFYALQVLKSPKVYIRKLLMGLASGLGYLARCCTSSASK